MNSHVNVHAINDIEARLVVIGDISSGKSLLIQNLVSFNVKNERNDDLKEERLERKEDAIVLSNHELKYPMKDIKVSVSCE